tara:strand:+ start:576 stop:1142 length:567 start_codon:yes stop_codon:yes gene_type:complete
MNISSKENFIDVLNLLKEKKTNKNIINKNNNKCPSSEIKNLFRKSIYVSYSKNKSNYFFTILNHNYELFLKINYTFDEINLLNINNKKIGFLINNKYNKYYFNLNELYKSNFTFEFINGYNKINIYSQNRNIYFQINKFTKNYKILENDICIGEILYNNSNYKINIDRSKKEYLTLTSIALSLFIKNN